MSTKMSLDPAWNPRTKPSYIDHFDQYLFGLSGEAQIELQKACVDQKPLGVQRIKTVEDGVITFLTLGIYSPVTIKVWCGQ